MHRFVIHLLLASAALASATPARADFAYALTVDPDLKHVDVRLTLAGRSSPIDLEARNGTTQDVVWAETCAGDSLVAAADRLTVPPDVACVHYRALLDPLFTGGSWGVRLSDRTRVASPSQFLWLPAGANDVRVSVEGSAASVPWPERIDGPGFVLRSSPESSRSMAVFGTFQALAVEGLNKPAAYVGPAPFADKLRAWLNHAVGQVAAVGGAFPNPDAQVLVFHVGARGNSPVPFGHVIRDQGETVAFYVDAERSLDDFIYDWTAAHEFAHLLLPYIDGRHKWISEGFASYYQNVLQMRSGSYTETEGWRRLARSFDRARQTGKRMSPNGSVRVGMREGRMMIYWSGAALALKADAALRSRAEAPTSLDALLSRFAACCLPAPRTWRGRAFFERLDELGGNGIMVALYDRYAERQGLPPVAEPFATLGLGADGKPASTALDNPVRQGISGAR